MRWRVHVRSVGQGVLALATAALLAGCMDTARTAPQSQSFAPPVVDVARDAAAGPAGQRDVRAFADSGSPNSSAYRIGPQDTLDVSVFQVPELSRVVQVSESGTIALPLIGEVRAAGRTAQAVEKDLIARYGAKYVRAPLVTVLIKEFNSQRITFDGAFKKPGVYPYRGNISLLQAMAIAENFDSNVADNTVLIFRTSSGERTVGRFDVDAIREGRVDDPKLEPGDVIVASSSETKVVFNNVMKVVGPITGFARLFY